MPDRCKPAAGGVLGDEGRATGVGGGVKGLSLAAVLGVTGEGFPLFQGGSMSSGTCPRSAAPAASHAPELMPTPQGHTGGQAVGVAL